MEWVTSSLVIIISGTHGVGFGIDLQYQRHSDAKRKGQKKELF